MQLAELEYEGNAAIAMGWSEDAGGMDPEEDHAAEQDAVAPSADPYFAGVHKRRLLTREEEQRLGAMALNRDVEARNRIVEANLRLVLHVVNKYYLRRQNLGALSADDLIEEGNLGLIRAAEMFDPAKGCRFSTYAMWWIRQYIDRLVQNRSQVISIPYYVTQARREQHRTEQKSRMDDPEEVDGIEEVGEDTETEIATDASEPGDGVTEGRKRAVEAANFKLVSLSAPSIRGEPESDSLGDCMEYEGVAPDGHLEDQETVAVLRKAISTLSPREQTILNMRFGIGTGQEKSLQEIGSVVGCSRECIRRTQIKAMAALRKQLAGSLL